MTNWVREAYRVIAAVGDEPAKRPAGAAPERRISRTARRLYAEKGIEISEPTLYRYQRDWYVDDSQVAFALSDLSGIDARLLAFPPVATDGPDGGERVTQMASLETTRPARASASEPAANQPVARVKTKADPGRGGASRRSAPS